MDLLAQQDIILALRTEGREYRQIVGKDRIRESTECGDSLNSITCGPSNRPYLGLVITRAAWCPPAEALCDHTRGLAGGGPRLADGCGQAVSEQ